jgi:hypothetical protein
MSTSLTAAFASAGTTTLLLTTVPAGFPQTGVILQIGSQAVSIGYAQEPNTNTLDLFAGLPSDVSAGTQITAISLANYHFYPLTQRGANVDVASPIDSLNGKFPDLRVTPQIGLQIGTQLNGQPAATINGGPGFPAGASGGSPANPGLQLYGPGDVKGFDTRHIIRTDPADGADSFEPNYFPFIEFDDPDIPWMFTPAQAAALPGGSVKKARLTPWLALVVLKNDGSEYTSAPATQSGALPTITPSLDALPDLSESYLWAHAQLVGDANGDTLDTIFTNTPQRLSSRIICPRLLEPDTGYTAFLVPATDVGCQAASGTSPAPPAAGASAINLAWNKANNIAPPALPVFYSFSFVTAENGDFLSLVLRLSARVLSGLGTRPVAVDDPRNLDNWGAPPTWGLPPVTDNDAILHLSGALMTPPPAAVLAGFQLTVGTSGTVQVSAPQQSNAPAPVFDITGGPVSFDTSLGQTATDIATAINANTATTGYTATADASNATVTVTAPASFGIFTLTLTIAATGTMNTGPLPTDEWSSTDKAAFQPALASVLNLAANPVTDNPSDPDPIVVPPIYGRYHAAVRSVTPSQPGWVNDLNLDPRFRAVAGLGAAIVTAERSQLMAAAWRQIAGVQLANQILRHAQLARAALQQTYSAVFKTATSAGLLNLSSNVLRRVIVAGQTVWATVAASRIPWRLLNPTVTRLTRPRGPWRRRQGVVGQTLDGLINGLNNGTIPIAPQPGPGYGAVTMPSLPGAAETTVCGSPTIPGIRTDKWSTPSESPSGAQDLNQTIAGPPVPGFSFTTPGATTTSEPGTVDQDSAAAQAFRAALVGLNNLVQIVPPTIPQPPSIDLNQLSASLLKSLDPATTVVLRAQSLVNVSSVLDWTPADPIEPIMAAPSFPQPMYAPLRDLSQEFLLPGISSIPPDSVGLLKPDEEFIEAYMVGLNFEMARQLLFNDYPTDQRGSYFRQFWDISGYLPAPTDAASREKLYDIPPINIWPTSNSLGSNPNPLNPDAAGSMILLVRGELLRRYPTTAIYAAPAVLDPNGGTRSDGGPNLALSSDLSKEIYPLFRGTLSPDITFLGFPLTETDVTTGGSGYGYFFVLQQQPTEPRFGLQTDPPTPANPVTQEYFAAATPPTGTLATPLPAFATVAPANADLPPLPSTWGLDSADMAKLTFLDPVRVAFYGPLMLPGGSA